MRYSATVCIFYFNLSVKVVIQIKSKINCLLKLKFKFINKAHKTTFWTAWTIDFLKWPNTSPAGKLPKKVQIRAKLKKRNWKSRLKQCVTQFDACILCSCHWIKFPFLVVISCRRSFWKKEKMISKERKKERKETYGK